MLTTEVQRNQQATLSHDFVGDILALDATANVVVIGDLNDFQFSPTGAEAEGRRAWRR